MARRWSAFTLLLVIGSALRLYHLGYRSLRPDEANVFWMARGTSTEIIRQNAIGNSAPPLYALALNPLAEAHASECALRSLSRPARTPALRALCALARAAALSAPSAPPDMGDMGRADGHGGTEHLRAVWIGAAGVGAQRRVRHRAALEHGTWRACGVVDAHAGSGACRGLVGVRRHAPPSAAPGRIRRRIS